MLQTGGTFLEAGALDGEYLSNTLYLERQLGWTGLLVEPDPFSFKKMVAKHRRSFLLEAGLAPSNVTEVLKLEWVLEARLAPSNVTEVLMLEWVLEARLAPSNLTEVLKLEWVLEAGLAPSNVKWSEVAVAVGKTMRSISSQAGLQLMNVFVILTLSKSSFNYDTDH